MDGVPFAFEARHETRFTLGNAWLGVIRLARLARHLSGKKYDKLSDIVADTHAHATVT
jgi:hypothetical protein